MPIPESLAAWIKEFVDMHYIEEPFKKRRRDEVRVDAVEDAKGDPRYSAGKRCVPGSRQHQETQVTVNG